jgi:hypothetical protein
MDMFSRRIHLYYNGKYKKYSMIGIIFTFLYITIFLVYFLYKFVKMMKKNEITIYDTYAYSGKLPSIQLTKENFYGAFSLEDPFTYDPFIDERIYYPKAYFKKAYRNGSNWHWSVKELEIERCKIEKFGNSYKDIFKEKPLHNLYCIKEMNETLIGHYVYDNYSLFYISFFPCKNTTENNNYCRSREDINYYLEGTFINFHMEDIQIIPQNFDSPIIHRDSDIYTTVGKKLFKEIHIFFQIINVETDLDVFGIDNFQRIKKNQYLKYETMSIMDNIIENDIYDTGESFCDVTIKLSDKILTQRRTFVKFIEILGNIGGFMGVIFSILKITCSFSTRILYDLSLVNNLFEFDIDKKIIIINNNNNNKRNINTKNKLYIPIRSSKILAKKMNTNEEDKINHTKDELNENKRKIEIILNQNSKNDKSEQKKKPSFLSSFSNFKNKNKFFNNTLNNESDNCYKNNDKSDVNIFNFNINYNNREENKKEFKMKKDRLIKNVKINNLCVYFCCFYVRKKKNVNNILLNEGLRVIIEQLDLLNIFKKLYKEEKNRDRLKNNDIIKMSDDCKSKLENICN